jgi:hypothetical protein
VTLFAAGDVPTADQLNKTIVIAKASSQIVNNSTTLVNDAEITSAVSANVTYSFQLGLMWTSNSTADIKWGFTFPTGAVCNWGATRLVSSVGGLTGDADFGAFAPATSGTSVVSAGGTGLAQLSIVMGSLMVGSTAGSLTLQWAQNTAAVVDTTVYAGTWMLLVRQ